MIPTLTSKRLTLRAPEARDHAAYAAFYASERSHIIGGPRDETAAWKVLANDVGHWHLRGFGWWALDDGTGCIGTCGFHLPAGRPEVELGWSLFSATGQGYATEAGRAALAWARETRQPWPRIVSHIDRGNTASQRVAARLGARDTEASPAHDPDCTIWEHAA
ncbi:GNAT family N-acetyltransferase [Jannaschia seohaensis]|uniref:Protein N-acetyltransferase, RimJ/RimL family n=1 Tax=Jannaschia seohaensis TaxID=475081 RepID=A0A2Y9C273_9RHOB|nr:GNAT family N-acetyltransferase [Jannaschia seohaensis]PWJ16189.1 RimJ/RimL family protein N-acetyltransferase [Jannaschia seohaensis]SSA49202.1 Protein N-acetyltransferase, RimJ/RimL family [Jannaschia seohaensis]